MEIEEHPAKFAENLIVEHLFYTISIAIDKRTTIVTFLAAQMV